MQIISLEGMCESWGSGAANSAVSLAGTAGAGGPLRALAFSVFSGSRRLLQHAPNGKSLTGFGTAANANLFINNKDVSTKHSCCMRYLETDSK